MNLSATPVRCELPPPLLGEHTEEVLQQVVGYDVARITALRAQGVL
jgi:crotonobetainyl-CoA:carnitine CoA-transferase CaiB-like acyl-CoA transferase